MTMDVRVFGSSLSLAEEAALLLGETLSGPGNHNLGLAGGSTPMPTYVRLAELNLNWPAIDLWLGDERWVDRESPECNAGMCWDYLASRTAAPFHEVPLADHEQPMEAAHAYESVLKDDILSKTDGRADVVLLGLGDDGHTASLFPDTEGLAETEHLYTATHVPKVDMWRLTATIPLLSQADHLFFLVSGATKAEAVRWLVNPLEGDPQIPARYVADAAENVTVLLDKSAASLISSPTTS